MEKLFDKDFKGKVNGVDFTGNLNEIEYVEYINKLFDKKLPKEHIMLLKKWYSLGIYLSVVIDAYKKMTYALSYKSFSYMAKIIERQYEMYVERHGEWEKEEPKRIDSIMKLQKEIIAEDKKAKMGNNIQLHELMTCLRDTVCVRIMSNNGNEILSGEVSGIKSLKGFHHSNVNTVMAGHYGLTLYIDDFSDDKGERIEDGI